MHIGFFFFSVSCFSFIHQTLLYPGIPNPSTLPIWKDLEFLLMFVFSHLHEGVRGSHGYFPPCHSASSGGWEKAVSHMAFLLLMFSVLVQGVLGVSERPSTSQRGCSEAVLFPFILWFQGSLLAEHVVVEVAGDVLCVCWVVTELALLGTLSLWFSLFFFLIPLGVSQWTYSVVGAGRWLSVLPSLITSC